MTWILPLLTLTAMELVLGIDNVVFISILVATLPLDRQRSARFIGIGLALCVRVLLLLGLRFIMGLETPLFHWSSLGWVPPSWVENHHVDAVTGKDLVLLAGGAFLVGKSVVEIHKQMMGGDEAEVAARASGASYVGVIAQIIVLDLVFSLDSVISAIGMAKDLWIMIVAMVVAVTAMAIFSGAVSGFIDRNPTFKMLALAFLVMIGVVLVSEGVGAEINRGYIYAGMIFALLVEVLNMRARRKKDERRSGDGRVGQSARLRAP